MSGATHDEALRAAEHFLVDGPDGEVGVVDEVIYGADGEVAALLVACGWFGRSRCLVHVENVVEVRPRERRVVVRATPRPRDHGQTA